MTTRRKQFLLFLAIVTFLGGLLSLANFFLEKKAQTHIEAILKETFEPDLASIKVNLSFFHRFPHPYLCIQNLKVTEHSDTLSRDILTIDEINAEVNFLKLLIGQYELKKVNIQQADLLFYVDSLGQNIRLFKYKERDTTREKAPFLLNLPQLHFQNIQLKGQNEFKKLSWEVNIQEADFQGSVKDGIIDLHGNAVGSLDSLSKNGQAILTNKPVEVKTDIEINPFEKQTTIKNGKLSLASTQFEAEGSIKGQYPEGSWLDLHIEAENEFDGLFGFFPVEIQSKFKQMNDAATSHIKVRFSGLAGPKQYAKLDAQVNMANAVIVSSEYGAKLDSLNFQLNFSNGETKDGISSTLTIRGLRGKLEGNPIALDLKLDNFDNPNLDLIFDFNLDLKDLTRFFQIPTIQKSSGRLALKGQVKVQPKTEKDWVTSLNGYLDFDQDDLILAQSNFNFSNLIGRIEIRDSLLFFNNLKGDFSGIPFNITGAVKNSYRLFRNNRKDLEFELDAYSQSINLNKVFDEISTTGQKVNKGSHPLHLPHYFAGKMQLNTPYLKYREATAQQFYSTIYINHGDISIPNLSADVLHGHLSLRAKLSKKDQQSFDLKSNIELGNLNTKRLLEIFENFDQQTLTSKHIEGRLSAVIQLNAVLNPDLSLPSGGISYLADFSLKETELIDFEPLAEALRHVKKKEAGHIYIDDLKGKALYHQNQMFIPDLSFTSNLTSISMHGSRESTEAMDFHVELSLGEFLFAKKRKEKKKNNKEGGMNVRLNLVGVPGKLKVKPKTKRTYEEVKRENKAAYANMKRLIF